MFKKFTWSKEYITGHESLDHYHEKMFEVLNELLDMLGDTKLYLNKIPEKTAEVKILILEHIELESWLIKKYNIPNYQEHIDSHNCFIERIENMVKHRVPTLIGSITMGDIVCEYFLDHFQEFDKFQLPILNQRIHEVNKKEA